MNDYYDRMYGYLQMMAQKNASDLHFGAGGPSYFRVNGVLYPTDEAPYTAEESRDLIYSIMSPEDIELFEQDKVVDFAFGHPDLGRYRINLYSQRGSVAVAVRLLPHIPPSVEELGIPADILKNFCNLSHGLVLICGPVGSGKTTTLAAMIDYVNRSRSCHIISIEDPIEFVHQNVLSLIHQREVRRDTPNFADALKYILREDPNIVVVGEMRDLETIASAITIAETGHLVFGTLHTGDAGESISRMIDVFPPGQQSQITAQLSCSLAGVVNQVLVRKADNTGRVVASEIMMVTPAIQNLIRENKMEQVHSHIQMGGVTGMHSMNQSLAELVKKKKITREMALTKTRKPKEFLSILEKKS